MKIWRGLVEGKHRRAMRERVWLYLYFQCFVNWDDGMVYDYRDADAADLLDVNPRTIRTWRTELAEDGYIICHLAGHSQTIEITKWIDPRNPEGDNKTDHKTDEQGDNKGDVQGSGKGGNGDDTSTSSSEVSYQRSDVRGQSSEPGSTGPVFKTWEKIRGAITPFDVDELRAQLDDWAIHLSKLPEGHPDRGRKPADVVVLALEETGKRADTPNLKYADTILRRWKREGVQNQRKKKDGRSEMMTYLEQKKKEMQL